METPYTKIKCAMTFADCRYSNVTRDLPSICNVMYGMEQFRMHAFCMHDCTMFYSEVIHIIRVIKRVTNLGKYA